MEWPACKARTLDFPGPLMHIRRRVLPVSKTSVTLANMSYITSYTTEFGNRDYLDFVSSRRKPILPYQEGKSNTKIFESMSSRRKPCTLQKKSNCDIDVLGVSRNSNFRWLQTSNQDSYKQHDKYFINTRYGLTNRKGAANGIVPVTLIDKNTERNIADHWLPGTLRCAVNVTVNGPYQFLPRKRKIFVTDSTAAGVGETKPKSELHRYHLQPIIRRGKHSPKMTVRCDH